MKMFLNVAVFMMSVISCCSGRVLVPEHKQITLFEFKYDDICTNECDDNNSTYWCGQRRMDGEGKMSRCVQYTRDGDPCVTSCQDEKDETYKWCRTNAVEAGEWWQTCSLEGFTINKEKCLDDCAMREHDYYWCHTNKDDKWDYCSPSSKVKPVQITTKGGQCKTQCEHHGEDYFWCTRNIDFCTGRTCDEYWAYCSLDDMHTTKGKECKEKCSKAGQDYYWCNTMDESDEGWDYCSPIAKAGVHLSLEIELDVYGKECRNLCSMQGEEYFWCKHIGGGEWWDYCSPQNMTRYNSPCSDPCERRGEEYFWCHTENSSSWDYCSPNIHSLQLGDEKKV
jgi:YHS domain-containing protein